MGGTTTEAIKEKLDLVEFLRGYLALQPAGKNWKALCPFHREKTASFMVSPERQTWHCFGCGAGGDVFGFIMRQENIEFGEALKILAERAGIELKRLAPGEYKYVGLLYELNEAATAFFVDQRARSVAAKEYLASRGLLPATIEEFGLGWAPQSPDALTIHLLNLGYGPEDILRAGLVLKTERGMQLDRFRGRIMFPLHNHLGKIIGFTGRILPQLDTGEMGKYVNSPETPIFNKSKALYGFWKTKNAIRETATAFMVEGQMDFLMSWQAGVKNVVATSGTALTPHHLRALRRLADCLVLSFDSDEAGQDAAERAIALAEAADFQVKVAAFRKHKDPAEAAQANPEEFVSAVAAARPAPELYFERYLPKEATGLRRREEVRNVRVVLAKLKNMASAIDRSFWLKELARRLGISEKVLIEEAEAVDAKPLSFPEIADEESPRRTFSRRELIAQRLLAAAVSANDFTALREHLEYLASPYQVVFELLEKGKRRSEDEALDGLLDLVVLQAGEFAPREIEELKVNLAHEYFAERRRALAAAVKEAEAAGNGEATQAALRELNQLPAV